VVRTPEEVLARPWFYEFELPDGRRTESYLPPEVRGIHHTRLEMTERAIDKQFGSDWTGRRALDLASHEGWFGGHLARRGCDVLGLEGRLDHVEDARALASLCGLTTLRFEHRDITLVADGELGPFDIVLVLGVLYHLENPIRALRVARSHTAGICLVETQLAPNLAGPIDWGSYLFVNQMVGSFAVVDESDDLERDSHEANSTPISLVPSIEALLWTMQRVGFSRVEVVAPPPDAHEQLRSGKRVMVAGYTDELPQPRTAPSPPVRPRVVTASAPGPCASHPIDEFTDAWWRAGQAGGTWQTTTWMGTPIQKHPFDLMMMQEIIWETKPQLIIEAGTNRGGSALFFAHLLDAIGAGEVLTTDVMVLPDRPIHPRIRYRSLSSISGAFLGEATAAASMVERTMVILDSDHGRDHVRAEMALLGPLVTTGCYLIVEDGCVNGHPTAGDFGPGPLEAIEDFLASRTDFEVDHSRERLLSTFNPSGYLRRRAGLSGPAVSALEQ
jgi:tRNA (mo5U34)-methyltransferase